MKMLGYEKEDLNTRKRREHFAVDTTDAGSYSPKREIKATVNLKDLKTVNQEVVNEELISLRFKHY